MPTNGFSWLACSADGLNLGLTRMAEACTIASLGQLAWTADWHIRDETFALALQRLINQQQREPLAAIFGSGVAPPRMASSSGPADSVAMRLASTPITAMSQEASSTLTSRTATPRSTPR